MILSSHAVANDNQPIGQYKRHYGEGLNMIIVPVVKPRAYVHQNQSVWFVRGDLEAIEINGPLNSPLHSATNESL